MQITKQFKLLPTREQEALIDATMANYIEVVNDVAGMMYMFDDVGKFSSSKVDAPLPSALKAQCCLNAASLFKRYCKTCRENAKWNAKHPKAKKPRVTKFPVLRRPVAVWNNQNYKINDDSIAIPVWVGKSKRIVVKAVLTQEIRDFLSTHKLGTLRITRKNGKLIAQVACEVVLPSAAEGGEMGIDLGLKCPAVCYTSTGKARFFGNGRKNKAMRRRFKSKRRKLGKLKKLSVVKKINNKEQRIMRDIDHKLSRQIVNYAVENGVATIKLEELDDIRDKVKKCSVKSKATSTSRKNNHALSSWSFYRLAGFIEYKAQMAGIKVEYVSPSYTSQKCPVCGERNHADDRDYRCKCGFHAHRDLVGAMNIVASPTGKRGRSASACGA